MDSFVEKCRCGNRNQFSFIGVSMALLFTVLFIVFYSIKSEISNANSWEPIKTKEKTMQLFTNCTVSPANGDFYGLKGKEINCNNMSLHRVPGHLPNDTFILDLSNNFIVSLESCQFCQMPFLQYLDLSTNSLTFLNNMAFEKLSNLAFMDLSNNELNNTLFQIDLFKPLKSSLTTLRINNCSYIEYPDQSLAKLHKLESLTLDGLNGQVLGEGFRNLTKLRYLTMSGWESRCSIKNLTKTMFYNTPYLQYLNISRCDISYVDDAALSPLKHIFVFNMSDNHGLELMRNICISLKNTPISVLILDRMERYYGHAIELTWYNAQPCQRLNLSLVSLIGNKIDYLNVDENKLDSNKPTFSYPVFNLEILYVSDNRFSLHKYFLNETIKNLWVYFFPCIRKIYVGNDMSGQYYDIVIQNRLYMVNETDIFDEIRYLKTNAKCTKVDRLFHSNVSDRYNTIKNSELNLPKTLEEIHPTNLFLSYNIPEVTLMEGNKLTVINLMGNHLFKWIGPIKNVGKHLKKLDLSVNYCANISNSFFSGMSSLEWLNLRINYLGDDLSFDTEGKVFEGLHSLKYLNLHLNRITSLPGKIFNSLISLEQLDLSHNSLTEFTIDISHITNLSSINLCNNAIESIPEVTRNHLDTIAANRNVTLHLLNNEIKCKCSNIGFLKWVNNSDITFQNKDSYTCRDQKWLRTNFTHLDHVIKSLEESCADWSGLVTGISIALGILVLTIIIAALYRKRWTLKYIYYTTLGRYRLIHEEQKDTGYKYDAFVSYDSSDRTFVIEEMLHYLEKQGDLNLCIHERDFTPGNAIAANIVDSIRDSRRTVCVMSSEFLQSKWCMFEFNMAKMESMFTRGGRPVHYLVLLDSFNSRDLPLEVLDVIESQSYIEFPNDELGNIVFWDKLRNTLKRRTQNTET